MPCQHFILNFKFTFEWQFVIIFYLSVSTKLKRPSLSLIFVCEKNNKTLCRDMTSDGPINIYWLSGGRWHHGIEFVVVGYIAASGYTYSVVGGGVDEYSFVLCKKQILPRSSEIYHTHYTGGHIMNHCHDLNWQSDSQSILLSIRWLDEIFCCYYLPDA